MDHTTNYHLPQWVETDRIMMGDFNQMCSDIDEGIAEAKEAADAAQQEAEEKGFVVGTYTGDGKTLEEGGQFIALDFHPRFVIISRGWSGSSYPSAFLVTGDYIPEGLERVFSIQSNGFTVGHYQASGIIQINTSDLLYHYVAFR